MNIVLISHRRSGTHLSIDTICNNFGYEHINLDVMDKKHPQHKILDLNIYENMVFKTHMKNLNLFEGKEKESILNLLESKNTKIIYVKRDTKDMLTSLYYYKKSFTPNIGTIDNFVTNEELIKYQLEQHNNWKDVFTLKYENLITQYDIELKRISEYLNIPIKKKKDVRYKKEGKTSSILYRKGIIGDYKNSLSAKSIELIDKIIDKYTI